MSATHCSDCGAAFVPSESTPGYARLPSGALICYSCADKRHREELKNRTGPTHGYLSSDGSKVTTWTGGTLMSVIESRPCKLTRVSHTHDRKSYRSIKAKDVHGGLWSGRGSPGIFIRLRPVKS